MPLVVEEAEQDGATYYRILDGKDILFSNMVGACARLLAQPEAAAVEAEPQPERKPLSQAGNMIGAHDIRPMNSEVTHGAQSLVLGIGTKKANT